MPSHVAFLRGMNLGGRRITNPDLCAAVEELGFTDVAAFLASGNVAFTGKGTPAALQKRIEAGLEKSLGYAVPTFIRSAAQVRAVAEGDPFAARAVKGSRGKPQVVFLAKKPTTKAKAAALALETDDDWLAIEGQELHWWPIGGLSTSEFDFKALSKIVGEPTVRTKNTNVRLATKYFS
ncbi:MAG: DUF1697 domain-containing protein [Myxococcota bacterium]